MKKIITILFLIGIFAFGFSYNYNISKPVQTEDDIADMYEALEISEEEYVELWDLYSNPVDINTASREDIMRLPNITEDIADYIIEKRPVKSEKELRRIVGKSNYDYIEAFTIVQYEKIKKVKRARLPFKPLIKFKYVDEVSSYHKRQETPYFQTVGRFKWGKKIDIGINEERKWKTTDFEVYNGSIQYDEDGKIIAEPGDVIIDPKKTHYTIPKAYIDFNTEKFQIILGNFGAAFGLGSTFNESGRRGLNGFKGDISSNQSSDYKRLFGGGLRLSINPITIYGFYSRIGDKCTVYSGLLELTNEEEVTSQEDYELLASSMRSIPNYIKKTVYGGHIDIGNKNNLIGFTLYHTKEDFETENYRPYTYSEDMYDAFVYGINANFKPFKNLTLQSEYSELPTGAYGFVFRSYLKQKKFNLEFIYRDFSRFFENTYSYTYATWDTPSEFSAQNERGIKLNSKMKIKRAEIRTKLDIWRLYSTLQTNFDGTIGIKYPISPLVDINISERYKNKDVGRDLNDSYTTDHSETDKSVYTYITLNYEPSEKLRMSTVYRYRTYMEHSEPQEKPSSALQYRINYKGQPVNILFSFKFNDDNLYRKYDSSSGQEYREFQFNLYKYLFKRKVKITLGYKRRYYTEDNSARNEDTVPEKRIKFYIDWRG